MEDPDRVGTMDLRIFLPVFPIPFRFNSFRTLSPSAAHNAICISFLFFHLQILCRHNGGGLQRHSFQGIDVMAKTDSSKPLTSSRSHLSLTRSWKQHTFRHQCARESSLNEKQTSPRSHFPF